LVTTASLLSRFARSARLVGFASFSAVLAVGGCQKRGAADGHLAEAGPITRPRDPVSLEDAQRYVLALVNHDRAAAGLPEVEWDAAAAKAGQRHADDMVQHGYTAHWGTDGSVPEQRYTEAGGADLVHENVACFFDGQARELEPNPTFTAVELEQIETAFMAETPPNDGHKKNILKKWHTGLGVGLAIPKGIRQPCMSQEFVDHYGEYAALPAKAHVGQVVTVSGEVSAPPVFGAVGVARIDAAHPLTAAHLNTTSLYAMPEPFVLYLPPGFVTPKPVTMKGNHFSIDVPLSDHGRSGRYSVSVWGKFPGDDAFTMVSLRVIDVR
jgi:uncharacterized protein YkwD